MTTPVSATWTPDAPTTAGMPQPRATTAAWLASPPVAVRIPAAAAIPWTSSGEVSARTRMTACPAAAASTAASGVVTMAPQATPGEAGRPYRQRRPRVDALRGRRRRIDEQLGDPTDGFGPVERERGVLGHVDGDPEGGLRAPLADAALEHPEPAVLDRELDVAQVAVVALEPGGVRRGAGRRRRAAARSSTLIGSVRWVPATTSSPWALNMHVAVQDRLAGRGIAGEEDARRRSRRSSCRTPSPGR